jgi:hypothetical protein
MPCLWSILAGGNEKGATRLTLGWAKKASFLGETFFFFFLQGGLPEGMTAWAQGPGLRIMIDLAFRLMPLA